MGKGPKLRLSFLNSIQLCRPNDPSTLVKSPLPTLTYIHSHHYSATSYDLSFPIFPDPPPSSSNHKIIQHQPKSCKVYQHQPRAHSTTKREDTKKLNHEGAPTQDKEKPMMKKKPKARGNTSGVDNFSSSSPSSSSSSSSFNTSCSSNQLEGEPLNRCENSLRQRSVRTRRFKRYGSKDWSGDESIAKLDNKEEPIKKHRQVVNHESFVVLKRSVDPYKDFKKSMLEMILERQIFEPKDLEQLLMSFLSLNSRIHHKAILKAFSEIWKEVFCGTFN